MKHFNITVRGKVQGVYYRASAKQIADLLGVKGFVRNVPDGNVFIEAEGEEFALTKFVQWCQHGPDNAVVEHVSVQEGDVISFEAFEIRRQ